MPDLATTQQLVSAALSDRARTDQALPLIAGESTLARDRLAVYRANIAANATGALAATYPIIHKLVGAEFFDGLAHAYCKAHPSVSGDLNEIGERLADFLRTFAPAQSLPYLPDVARLEWLAHQAHYAADHAPLDASTLAAISPADYPRLALSLHPAVAVLSSAYPLHRIWEVHQDDYRSEIAVDLGGGGESVVIYRPLFHMTVAELARGEFAFLNAIARGVLLGPALATAMTEDAGFDLASSLRRWTIAHIVVGVSAGD